ncbi:MAG: DUF6268 family outer membrane beta-barrel protein [Phycisphaerales bacterium]
MRQTNRWTGVSGAALLALGLACGFAPAQDRTSDENAAGDEALAPASRWSLSLNLSSGYIGEGDLDRGPGDLDIFFAAASADLSYAIDRTSRITLVTSGAYWHYDFDGATGLIAGTSEPFSDLSVGGLGLVYSKRIDEHWSIIVGAHVRSAGESGADFGDTITFSAVGGFQYAFSDSFSVGLSLLVSSQLEDDVLVIPIPTIDWKIDERWRFASEAQVDQVLYLLSYKLNDQWNVGLGAGFYSQRFRLDKNGPVPNGLTDVFRVMVAGRAAYTPSEHVTIALTGGFVVYHDIELMNAAGGHLSSDEVQPAPMVGLSVGLSF